MQWQLEKQTIREGECYKYLILSEGRRLSIDQVWNLWQHSPDFRLFYNDFLAKQEFEALFWEHPPYAPEQADYPYEVVATKSTMLAGQAPELQAFEEHFSETKSITSFINLGGDARLMVPCPVRDAYGKELQYAHLAEFCRNAPEEQIHDFWKYLGGLCKESLGGKYRWLSTAGMGVYWLHVRLDEKPKYYQHKDYT